MEWQHALVEDHVPLDLAQSIVQMAGADRSAFWRLIAELRLGKNRQREFLLLLQDVARIQGKTLAQLIEAEAIDEIVRMEKLTPSQKAERLKERLWERRYPHYMATKKQFEELVKEAACPPALPYSTRLFLKAMNCRSHSTLNRRKSIVPKLIFWKTCGSLDASRN